ncbi:MAG TPA: hypothetical protein VKB46_20695 [Pyrinomonadaceae bacterium]|nr:hypothetical protein [Pyrinomonadaceae bacterium]
MNKKRAFLLVLLGAAVILLASPEVFAQGCSMCKAVLTSSTNGRFIRNFNIGVLVLLIPPVSIFCSIFIVLKRHNREAGAVATGSHDSTHEQGE